MPKPFRPDLSEVRFLGVALALSTAAVFAIIMVTRTNNEAVGVTSAPVEPASTKDSTAEPLASQETTPQKAVVELLRQIDASPNDSTLYDYLAQKLVFDHRNQVSREFGDPKNRKLYVHENLLQLPQLVRWARNPSSRPTSGTSLLSRARLLQLFPHHEAAHNDFSEAARAGADSRQIATQLLIMEVLDMGPDATGDWSSNRVIKFLETQDLPASAQSHLANFALHFSGLDLIDNPTINKHIGNERIARLAKGWNRYLAAKERFDVNATSAAFVDLEASITEASTNDLTSPGGASAWEQLALAKSFKLAAVEILGSRRDAKAEQHLRWICSEGLLLYLGAALKFAEQGDYALAVSAQNEALTFVMQLQLNDVLL